MRIDFEKNQKSKKIQMSSNSDISEDLIVEKDLRKEDPEETDIAYSVGELVATH